MNDKELEKVQHELENKLTEEEKTDNMIISAAQEIASALIIHKGKLYDYTINDVKYLFNYCIDPKTKDIVVAIVNVDRYNLSNGKLGLNTARAPLDENYSLKEGLASVIEGYIRHITGNIKPEMLEDE